MPGTQEFLKKVTAIVDAQSPDLLQRAHDLLGAPSSSVFEFGFNLPALLIALVITAHPDHRHQRERALQCRSS